MMTIRGRKVALLSVILVGLVACSAPWKELQSRYRTEDAVPSVREEGKSIALFATGYKGVFSYRGMVTQSFDSKRVYLALKGPFGITRRQVSIPLSAITACSRTEWRSGWDTNLWLADPRVEISFKDDHDDRILKWCEANHIPLVDSQTQIRLLYPNGNKGDWGTR